MTKCIDTLRNVDVPKWLYLKTNYYKRKKNKTHGLENRKKVSARDL